MAMYPFEISIPESKLEVLRQKLALAEFPDELDGAKWDYGAPLADIKRLVARWIDGYDWRAEESKLNAELPQFTTDIKVDGFETLNSSPEFPSFHVVTFSLPGYGFSEATHKRGFAADQYAEIGHKLMVALGYQEYVTQGGDWGSLISRVVAQKYGGVHCKAWHMNMPTGSPLQFRYNPLLYIQHLFSPYSAAEKAGFKRAAWFAEEGQGYFKEQATQPQTVGYSLADSPVGLLAWIYEKLVNWTDSYPWTDDEVLTWVSIYYFSRAGPAASVRIYYEVMHSERAFVQPPASKPTIPLGISYFPKELFHSPRKFNHNLGRLVFQSEHPTGGHFAAHECPGELVNDLRKMFGKQGVAYGVVSGKNGYERKVKTNL
ncbi:hypothetical protein D9757_010101 [Collybiopsis confluens]|uniref:Epoxide hydrolase n=1 Tax=Collybiopsis confluens TaxID=2823264 RepID=A0A8H5LS17_9AGAR|nr:hypothetical protein D9757_010101 [Collybiopsis confluens]